jgi:GH25 family lysozyme M1 (1,4-beta-N-acetylmuramidase)
MRPLSRRPLARLVLMTSAVAMAFSAMSSFGLASVDAQSKLPGIDISHWQGDINWSKISHRQVRFVIAKATEGQTYDDPMYATYRIGAAREGIPFTAYHFAQPDSTPGDAVTEAKHFVTVAALRAGNLIPALDLEVSGGLEPCDLITWTLDWLSQATVGLGVKPMIYTSNGFWRSYMNNTEKFAKAGYRLLWIAHWHVKRPSVPGKNWDHNGWAFWQWDNCGVIKGIDGCVDRDRYNGSDLRGVTIR